MMRSYLIPAVILLSLGDPSVFLLYPGYFACYVKEYLSSSQAFCFSESSSCLCVACRF